MSRQPSRLDKSLYLLLALTSSFMAILGFLYVAFAFGILGSDEAGGLAMVYSFTLFPIGLVIACVTLVASIRGLVHGPPTVRRQILTWGLCFIASVLPLDRVSERMAASVASVGSIVLVALPIAWHVRGTRVARMRLESRQGQPGMGRSVLAIIAGWIVLLTPNVAMPLLGLLYSEHIPTIWFVVFVTAILAGYIAGFVAMRAPVRHALGVVGLSLATNILILIAIVLNIAFLSLEAAHIYLIGSGTIVGGYLRQWQVLAVSRRGTPLP